MGVIHRIVTSAIFQRTGLARRFTTLMGRFADRRLPGWLLHAIIRKYIRINRVNMSDFVSDLSKYLTFNQFFSRPLLPGVRLQSEGINSPADGVMSAAGNFQNRHLFHVKGSYYPLDKLLGKPGFNIGSFATIYLSPANYHRVHAPFDGIINAIRHLHGKIQTVNPDQLSKDPMLYCTNERVVLEGVSEYGKFFMVLVGAVVVGRIKISITDRFGKGFSEENLSIPISKGNEIGLFEMGSTVIIILNNNHLSEASKYTGMSIEIGNSLACPVLSTPKE